MYRNVSQGYVDDEILTADPMRLVQLLYRGAIDAVAAARAALAVCDISARSQKISKASAILNELAATLDHSRAPELCRNLVELYDYMLRRLIEANVRQVESPLIEVERLLGDLLQAWRQAAEQQLETPFHASCAPPGPAVERERVSYAW